MSSFLQNRRLVWQMQPATLGGFATSYPMNWWLLHKGIKGAM
ncbi:MAG TPA: DUF4396 domain-containing protein [Ktedonobacteraceae bacterium]|nr:DUF4396 domain-containing protein [Ktedonobacteraceae bacterium]